MASCTKCRAALPPGAAFCPACGKKQAVTPKKKKSLETTMISRLFAGGAGGIRRKLPTSIDEKDDK